MVRDDLVSQDFEDRLQQCTVKVTVPGRSGWGTGFVVAQGVVLTCRHVVKHATEQGVEIYWRKYDKTIQANVQLAPDEKVDLALLYLIEPPSDHICVYLDKAEISKQESLILGESVYCYGYLKDHPNAAPALPEFEGFTGDTPPLIKFKDATIQPGISGAALANPRTARVCGVVKETMNARYPSGGCAIPSSVILQQFNHLKLQQQQYHQKHLDLWIPAPAENFAELQEFLATELKKSLGRCIARWQSIGVNRNDATILVNDVTIGAPPPEIELSPGKLIVLVGEMGVGKSLIGERILQEKIRQSMGSLNKPIPIFLESWDLQDVSIEKTVKEITNHLSSFKIDESIIIIDDLERLDSNSLNRVLNESLTLVNTYENLLIILISKPKIEFEYINNLVWVEPQSSSKSEELVRRLSKFPQFSNEILPEVLKDAISRPLYTILLSTHIKNNGISVLHSKEQLISDLVERSLLSTKENLVEINNLLVQLAAKCTDRGGKPVPISEIPNWVDRQKLLESNLIVEENKVLFFPIPILTQWFSSQYLLSQDFDIKSLIADRVKLEHWLYSLAIAVATFPLNQVSNLLILITENEPLFAIKLVREALAFQARTFEAPFLSPVELADFIRGLLQSWLNGFKKIAIAFLPDLAYENIPTIGVRYSDRRLEVESTQNANITTSWIEVAWYSGDEDLPSIVELPQNLNNEELNSIGWNKIYGFVPYAISTWVWRWAFEQIMNKLFRFRNINIPSSLLSLEAAWHAASIIAKRDFWDLAPIPINLITNSSFDISLLKYHPMLYFCFQQLEIETKSAKLKGRDYLELPKSFQSFRRNEHHSLKSLVSYATDAYLGALDGYLLLHNSIMSIFPSIELISILPARLIVVIILTDNPNEVIVSRCWELLPHNGKNEVNVLTKYNELSFEDLIIQNAFQSWQKYRPKMLHQFNLITNKVSPFTHMWLGQNPITSLAYELLWEDFKRLGWVDSNLGGAGFPYTY